MSISSSKGADRPEEYPMVLNVDIGDLCSIQLKVDAWVEIFKIAIAESYRTRTERSLMVGQSLPYHESPVSHLAEAQQNRRSE
jgi:hypothetical protein